MVGHSVRNDGGGVFDDLGDLRRGNAIEVEGADSALTYRVQSVDVLSKDELARRAEKIFAQTGLAGWSLSAARIGTALRGGPTS